MPTDEKYPNPDAQAVLVEGFELVDGVLRLNRTSPSPERQRQK